MDDRVVRDAPESSPESSPIPSPRGAANKPKRATMRRHTNKYNADDLPAPAWVRILEYAAASDIVAVRRLTRGGRERTTRHLAGTVMTACGRGIRLWSAERSSTLITDTTTCRGPSWISAASFSTDGTRVLTVDDDAARVWDRSSGRRLFELSGHADEILFACFSKDDAHASFLRVATASRDATARVWSATGALLLTLQSHSNAVTGCDFSSDGSALVTSSWDKTARIWDSRTGALRLTLEGHTAWLSACAFSSSSSSSGGGETSRRAVVATCGWDQTARVWDAATGKRLCTLKGHSDVLHHVSFSPDGQRLVTSSSDGTARIWDCRGLPRVHLLFALRGHALRVNCAMFSRPDGRRLVTASQDGTARTWDAWSGKLLDIIGGGDDGSYVPACDFLSLALEHTRSSTPHVVSRASNGSS